MNLSDVEHHHPDDQVEPGSVRRRHGTLRWAIPIVIAGVATAAGLVVLFTRAGGGSSKAPFMGYLHRVGTETSPFTGNRPVTTEEWVGANGGGLRRRADQVEGIPYSTGPGSVTRGIAYERIMALPHDPAALVTAVHGWPGAPSGPALDRWTLRMLSGIAVEHPLPADLQTAIGQALKSSPGVSTAVEKTPDGRPAIHVVSPGNPRTGQPRRDIHLAEDSLQLIDYREAFEPGDPRAQKLARVQRQVTFTPIQLLATLPAELPQTRASIEGGTVAPGGGTPACLPTDPRACGLLEDAGTALTQNQACPAHTASKIWEAGVSGVVQGRPVHVRWCGESHAKPLLLTLGPDTTFRAELVPIAEPTLATCIRSHRLEHTFPEDSMERRCAPGRGANWYRARITVTHGSGWIVSCVATARDRAGGAIFSGRLGFGFAGMFGNVSADPGNPAAFDWYVTLLDANGSRIPPKADVARYDAECWPNAVPPV